MTDEHPQLAQRTLVTRGGGIGARLPGNATRKTARKGVAPVALPYAWFTTLATPSVIDDIAEYDRLGIKPHEVLREWISVDGHLARRHQPEFWLRIKGIDLASITDSDDLGPRFSLPSPPGSRTDGVTLLWLHAEVRWRDSPVYGLLQFRRGWPEVKITIEGIEHARNRYDVQMAERGLALAQGVAPRGRTPVGPEQELDRLADLARRWAEATGRAIDDVTWRHLAVTDVCNRKKLEHKASSRGIRIGDVQRRARERDALAPPTS
jgi:hypothetical protein